MGLAVGPCHECGYRNDNIELTNESWPGPDGCTYWRVVAGQVCGLCGKRLTVFLEHPILELPVRIAVEKEAE